MRTILMTLLLAILINMTGCSHVAGNVVPQTGPTMEQVYDSMETESEPTVKKLAKEDSEIHSSKKTTNEFKKIPNPELHMYVYPHLAGRDEVPIPGYDTMFNAYTRDHYEQS